MVPVKSENPSGWPKRWFWEFFLSFRCTIALGCHSSGSPTDCRSYYDNIKVHILVEIKPRVITGNICRLPLHKYPTLGGKMRPADSCKQIYDANLTGKSKSSAVTVFYWIKTARAGTKSSQTFCEMDKGRSTLVGKISGQVGNIFNSSLVRNVNSNLLKSPGMKSGSIEYACLDARHLAAWHSSAVMISSSENHSGVGNRWIRWKMPLDRNYGTWWNHGVGQAKVAAANANQVTVTASNGKSQVRDEQCKEKERISCWPIYPNK